MYTPSEVLSPELTGCGHGVSNSAELEGFFGIGWNSGYSPMREILHWQVSHRSYSYGHTEHESAEGLPFQHINLIVDEETVINLQMLPHQMTCITPRREEIVQALPE
jgi:hypothetical protein